MSKPTSLAIVPPPPPLQTVDPAPKDSTTSPPTSRPSSSSATKLFSPTESAASETTVQTPTICNTPPFWTTPVAATTASPQAHPQHTSPPRSSSELIIRHHGGSTGALIARTGTSSTAPSTIDEDDVDPDDAPPAIIMHDNENEDLDGKGDACWAKSVRVTGWMVVEGSVGNIGAFVVWSIWVETQKGAPMEIHKRYSEFDRFRGRLLRTFPRAGQSVPTLPPKTMVARFDKKFLEKRRQGLQHFLNCILLNPEFSASPIMKEFLFNN